MILNHLFTIGLFVSLGVFLLSGAIVFLIDNESVGMIGVLLFYTSIISLMGSFTGIVNTPVRVKSETYSIMKITNKHYMIKKGNVVEIHKLPDRYHLTSKKSYAKTDKAVDYYVFASSQDQLGKFTVYLNDKR
jgi:hypothetical protein